jgi:hypothetical protein
MPYASDFGFSIEGQLPTSREESELERHDRICRSKGINLEDIKTWPEEYAGAPTDSKWHATVGDYDLDCTVGTGSTAEAAIEDLLDQLED